jgi:DNA-binding MarR family transcriptional regulator
MDPSVNLSGFYLIHDLARAIRRRFDEQARQHGLTMPQWKVLGQLSKVGELSQVALANLADMDPMTLSGIVDRLEAKGLVERIPDPNDNRAKLVRNTGKAQELVVEIRAVARELYEEALQGVSEEEREALFEVLKRIVCNLSNEQNLVKELQE